MTPSGKKRLLFHPGFRTDTWSSIEERYLWLAGPLDEFFDVFWLVPPTGSKYSRCRPENRDKEPIFVTHLKQKKAKLIEADITKWNVVKNILLVSKLYKDHSIDAVYTHFSPLGYYLELVAKLRGVKVIRGEHNFTFEKGRKFKRLKWLFWKWTTDYYIAVSRSVVDHLKSLGLANDRNAGHVYNGFDFSKIPSSNIIGNRQKVIEECGWKSNARILGCFAKLKADKRQHVLLDMLAQLPENVCLLLVGDAHDGEYSSRLKKTVREKGLGHRVHFAGYRRDVYELMDVCDITYLPSLFEGLPNAPIESFLMGTSVIASDLPPLREIVDHGIDGYLVDRSKPEDFLRFTIELLQDSHKMKEFGRRGRDKVRRLFDKEQFIQRSMHELFTALESA